MSCQAVLCSLCVLHWFVSSVSHCVLISLPCKDDCLCVCVVCTFCGSCFQDSAGGRQGKCVWQSPGFLLSSQERRPTVPCTIPGWCTTGFLFFLAGVYIGMQVATQRMLVGVCILSASHSVFCWPQHELVLQAQHFEAFISLPRPSEGPVSTSRVHTVAFWFWLALCLAGCVPYRSRLLFTLSGTAVVQWHVAMGRGSFCF